MTTTAFSVGILALFSAVLVTPASAQMCGGGQQIQASGNIMSSSAGMMCGGTQAADDPMADKPADKPKASGMMCPCCRNMAMMRGGTGGMQHNMPGMEMPKQ
jgi:hypothetical protein